MQKAALTGRPSLFESRNVDQITTTLVPTLTLV
jgi:hypothetical protein